MHSSIIRSPGSPKSNPIGTPKPGPQDRPNPKRIALSFASEDVEAHRVTGGPASQWERLLRADCCPCCPCSPCTPRPPPKRECTTTVRLPQSHQQFFRVAAGPEKVHLACALRACVPCSATTTIASFPAVRHPRQLPPQSAFRSRLKSQLYVWTLHRRIWPHCRGYSSLAVGALQTHLVGATIGNTCKSSTLGPLSTADPARIAPLEPSIRL